MQQQLVSDFHKILNEVKSGEVPAGLTLPDSFEHLVSEMNNKQYDAKMFAFMLRGMVSCLLCEYTVLCYSKLIYVVRNGFLNFFLLILLVIDQFFDACPHSNGFSHLLLT